MKLSFWKLSGAGNDFILLWGLPQGKSGAALARNLCNRRLGIGADGLLVIARRSGKVHLDYWNADGSSAFCGNGVRCAALWAAAQGWLRGPELTIDTKRGPLAARLSGQGRAEVSMPAPKNLRLRRLDAPIGEKYFPAHYVDTGVPHVVVVVPAIEAIDVVAAGRSLRFHKAFGRMGANVNFVEIAGNILHVRTYERGVEEETLACGTGIVASAFVARILGFSGSPVKVKARGGSLFTVSFLDTPRLEGPGAIIFSGEISL